MQNKEVQPQRLHPLLESKVRLDTIIIGGKTPQSILKEYRKRIRATEYANKSMMRGAGFITLTVPMQIDIVIVQVQDLAIQKEYPTVEEIYARAQELGLGLLPAEAAPHYRLQYMDQPLGETLFAGMEPIVGSDGGPNVFGLAHDRRGLWLFGTWVLPSTRRRPEDKFMFGLSEAA